MSPAEMQLESILLLNTARISMKSHWRRKRLARQRGEGFYLQTFATLRTHGENWPAIAKAF